MLNGSFLAVGSEQGLVGGIFAALAFAALNVGGAFMAAILGARLLTHRNALLKIVGALAVVTWVCFTFLLNLALAHYREVAGEFNTEAGRNVITRLQEAPLLLNDVQSWVLFGIGLLFAVAAFADSLLLFFDPYWGYDKPGKAAAKIEGRATRILKLILLTTSREIYSYFSQTLGKIGEDLSARLGRV